MLNTIDFSGVFDVCTKGVFAAVIFFFCEIEKVEFRIFQVGKDRETTWKMKRISLRFNACSVNLPSVEHCAWIFATFCTATIFGDNLRRWWYWVRSTFLIESHLLRINFLSYLRVYLQKTIVILLCFEVNLNWSQPHAQSLWIYNPRNFSFIYSVIISLLFWSPETRVSARRPMHDLAIKLLCMFLRRSCFAFRR